MPHKILHVIPAIAPRYGGPSAATLGLCRALIATGTDVAVVTTDADGPHRLQVTRGEMLPHEGIPVAFFRRQVSEAFKYSRPLAAWLDTHVREYDVVHVHAVFSHASVAAGRAAQAHQVPYIVRPLGTLDPWSVRQKAWRKRLALVTGARRLLTRAAAIHYTSAEEMRLAESAFPFLPRGVVIPLGIDAALSPRPDAADESSSPYIVCLTRLHEKKGIDLLIRAFSAVLDGDASLAHWRLVIAGDGDPAYVAELRRLAAARLTRVSFMGWVDGEEKVSLLNRASLFALPSHQENFGLSIVEAMACGVPVIVTPGVNLSRDIATAGAGWIVDRTLPAIATQLRQAMHQPAERIRRGRQAAAFAAPFRWPAIAVGLNRLYDDVLRAVERPERVATTAPAPVAAWSPKASAPTRDKGL